jgi:hypothetical protein
LNEGRKPALISKDFKEGNQSNDIDDKVLFYKIDNGNMPTSRKFEEHHNNRASQEGRKRTRK